MRIRQNGSVAALAAIAALLASAAAAEQPRPPQSLPDWKVDVVAHTPDLKYPTVVCMIPDGRILVAEDPMDGLASQENRPIDRILCIHPDGKITLFAEGLHSIFGMQYIDGKVYVHHTPKFSVFRDDNSVGKERVDLIDTTNPSPGGGGTFNDHAPSNIRLAMDGYLYMSTGDKGIYKAASNVDKRTAEIHGGGILRIRPDGTDMEVYCTGTRNHLDVSINAEDEMFTYDNTDDGNGWWTRFTHMVDGGFYGYPFDYRPHPSDLEGVAKFKAGKGVKPWQPYTLWRMDEYGGGSPCGGMAYNEDALPDEYHGNMFQCEWGKGQLERFVVERDGGTFKIDKHENILSRVKNAGKNSEFRPFGIAVLNDGTGFLVADWNYDGWKVKSGEFGRLLKVTYTGPSKAQKKPDWYVPAAMGQKFSATTQELIQGLSHPAESVRLVAQRRLSERSDALAPLTELLKDEHAAPFARWHAIWTLDKLQNGAAGREAILAVAINESSPLSVRMQALRQLGDRKVKEALPGLIHLLDHPDAAMRLRAATALGRIGDAAAVAPLVAHLGETDFFTHYAMFNALNRIGRASPAAWTAIANELGSDKPGVRDGCVFAMRNVYDETLVKALSDVIGRTEFPSDGRAAAIRALALIAKQTKPWDGRWWGTQPVKEHRPAHDVAWAGTELAMSSLKNALRDGVDAVRSAALDAFQIASDASVGADLVKQFQTEKDLVRRKSILRALAASKPPAASALIAGILKNPDNNKELLNDALNVARQIGTPELNDAVIGLAGTDLSKELLMLALEAMNKAHDPKSVAVLSRRLSHSEWEIDELAANVLAEIKTEEAGAALIAALKDKQPQTRRAAAKGLERLKTQAAIEPLLACVKDKEMHRDVIKALAGTPDIRALDVYLEGLGDKDNDTREHCRQAVEKIRDKALPAIEAGLAANTLSASVIDELQRIYKPHLKPGDDGGKLFKVDTQALSPESFAAFAMAHKGDAENGKRIFFAPAGASCYKCHKIGGEGAEIGPELSSIGAKYDREKLIENVLYPSKIILDGFQQTLIKTKSGTLLSGLVRGENDSELTVIDSSGQKTEVKKTDIALRKVSEISLMPEGLHKSLKPEEFADLISYLETLREKAPEQKK